MRQPHLVDNDLIQRAGPWLALVAIWAQIVVPALHWMDASRAREHFGLAAAAPGQLYAEHVHAGHVHGIEGHPAHAAAEHAPADTPRHHADDACVICAVQRAGKSVLLAPAPILLPAALLGDAGFANPALPARDAARRARPEPRAPPQSV